MNNVMAIIPARSGSKGVSNKNIRLLGGHPLIAWSIKAAIKTISIDRVIVSTDSEEYAEIATHYGAEVPFFRPKNISSDSSTDFDFIEHALNWFAKHDQEPKYIAHIRPTTPFREPLLINEAVNLFINTPNITSLRSAHEMSESAYKAFEITNDGIFKRLGAIDTDLDVANNARQGFSSTYQANGYVDVLSSQFIRRHGIIHGDRVLPFLTPVVVEVDTEDDFSRLEYQLFRSNNLPTKLFD